MIGKRTEKLMERFVDPYKVKKIVLANVVELELLSIINQNTSSSKYQQDTKICRASRGTEKEATSSSCNWDRERIKD